MSNTKKIIIIIVSTLCVYTGLFFAGQIFLINRGHGLSDTINSFNSLSQEDIDFVPDTVITYAKGELLVNVDDKMTEEEFKKLIKNDGGEITGYNQASCTFEVKYDVDYQELLAIQEKMTEKEEIQNTSLNYVVSDTVQDSVGEDDQEWADEVIGFDEVVPEKKECKAAILTNMAYNRDKTFLDEKTGTESETYTFKNKSYKSLMEIIAGLSSLIKDDNKVIDVSFSMNELRTASSQGNKDAKTAIKTINLMMTSVLKNLMSHDYVIVKSAGDNWTGLEITINHTHDDEIKEDIRELIDEYAKMVYVPKLDADHYKTLVEEAKKLLKKEHQSALEKKQIALYYIYEFFTGEEVQTSTRTGYDFISGISDEDLKKRIIVVGSVSKNGTYSSFSSIGKNVDLVAPGDSIYLKSEGNSTQGYSSTAYAAAYVSSVLVHVQNVNQDITGNEMKELVTKGTKSHVFYNDKNYYNLMNAKEAFDQAQSFETKKSPIESTTKLLEMYEGESRPIQAADGVYYASENTSIAMVTPGGKVLGTGAGRTRIAVYNNSGEQYVEVVVKKIDLNLSVKQLEIVKGDHEIVKAQTEGPDGFQITWSSMDDAVATVEDGTITGNNAGRTIVTAEWNGLSRDIQVNVVSGRITLDETEVTLTAGKTKKIKANIEGENQTPTWTSANPSIARVNSSGEIKGIKAGTTTITVEANDVSKKITVKVKKKKSILKKLKDIVSKPKEKSTKKQKKKKPTKPKKKKPTKPKKITKGNESSTNEQSGKEQDTQEAKNPD